MSMHEPVFGDYAIPADTHHVAHAAFPKGSVAIQVRDAFGPIFNDTAFAELYPALGQTSRKPSTIGLRHRAPPLAQNQGSSATVCAE